MTRSSYRLSAGERSELWGRWKDGQTLAEIADGLQRRKSTIYTVLQRAGGIAPRARCRSPHHLSAAEREEISRGVVAGLSMGSIARQLGRSTSTISREIARNGGAQEYRAEQAEHRRRSVPAGLGFQPVGDGFERGILMRREGGHGSRR